MSRARVDRQTVFFSDADRRVYLELIQLGKAPDFDAMLDLEKSSHA